MPKRPFDDATDQPLGNLLRIEGRITSLDPPIVIGKINANVIGGPPGLWR